ncbi:MAG: hypothetical protein Q7J16_03175 [Candidatus Cloacimonadales bacterium]|nr:hypothetical protein [Candidatus Cloacimonadales bacterium]
MSNEKPLLSWTSHPLLDYPKNSIILFVFIIILAVSLWRIAVIDWEMPLFYYLGLLIFLFSLAPYFILTRYEFWEDKIVIYYWFIRLERKYSDYKSFYKDKKGVMLSTFKMHRRLDAFRGLNIRFSKTGQEKEELFKLLKEKISDRV